jgi:energy-coupling factor transport system ATP-binding protein
MEKEDPFGLDRSGRKRVAVASVLAAGPEVLVLDEPTTGLDYAGQRNMMEMVRRLNREAGATVVFITHHMWVVAEYAHRVVVMSDGHILMDDSPRAVFSRPDVMREARLKPPHIVDFSSRLGTTMLTVDEMVACTRTGRDES